MGVGGRDLAVDCGVRCLDCQYELRGLPSGPCPECGRVFDIRDLRTFDCGAFRRWSLRRLTLTTLVAAAMPWAQCAVLHLGPVAWLVQFGRWPSLSPIDDPGEMAAYPVLMALALLLAVATITAVAIGSSCVAWATRYSFWRAVGLAGLGAAVWLGGVWVLRADPLGVTAWLMD